VASVRRPGRDITLITPSASVDECLAVAEVWAERGVEVEVLDISPANRADHAVVVASVARTRNAVILGASADLACLVYEELFADLEHPIVRLAAVREGDELNEALRHLAS
jgi:pyruvate/2-oxoglutarate/acetoin dehydrogenase E1 component